MTNNEYLLNALNNFDKLDREYLPAPTDDLNRYWGQRSQQAVEVAKAPGVSKSSLLFTAYISPIGRVVGGLGVKPHEYADDTQLYVEMTDRGSLDRLSRCISCLQHWFLRSHLLLSGGKSDAIIIGTFGRVAESRVAVSDSLKLLGVTLDRTMSFDKNVSSVVRACNFRLSALWHIRSLVSDTVAQQIACTIAGSRLDYCNSLLVNFKSKPWQAAACAGQPSPCRLQLQPLDMSWTTVTEPSLAASPGADQLQTGQTLLSGYFFPTVRLPCWFDEPIQSVSFAAIIHTEASVSSPAQLIVSL